MSGFNAKAARTKRPCPIWVDAFQRDTQHLEADEVGAYFLLLVAMWTREDCALPDDDMRLARVCRVSLTLWKRRIGPVIREFLTAESGVVFQKRLRREASFVEHGVELQSNRKSGKSADNALKSKDQQATADTTPDPTVDNPTQQPNNLHLDDDDSAGASATHPEAAEPFRVRLLEAMGVGPDGIASPSSFIGTTGDMAEARRWLELPGLTEDIVITRIREVMARKAGGPPKSFSYFTGPMQQLSGELTAPKLTPIHGFRQQEARPARPPITVNVDHLDDYGNRIA